MKEICVCDRLLLLLLLLLLLSGPGTEGPRHTHDGWRLVSRENGGNRRHRGDIKYFPSILPLGKHFGNSDELYCQSEERKWSSQGLFKQTEAESILMNLLCSLSPTRDSQTFPASSLPLRPSSLIMHASFGLLLLFPMRVIGEKEREEGRRGIGKFIGILLRRI